MDLFRRFALGEIDAFETLVRQFQGEVYAWIVRIVRDPGIAEDLTVETLWRIYRARHRFRVTAFMWAGDTVHLLAQRSCHAVQAGGPSFQPMAVGRCPSGASALGRWAEAARSARRWSAALSWSLSNTSKPSSSNATRAGQG